MEIASIKHHTDFDFPINPSSRTNTKTNCITTAQFTVSDIEMIALQAAAAYTSLKDLMPSTPTSVMSPTLSSRSSSGGSGSGKDSWRDIPIKDPLLQHAAWAYLQPMAPDHRPEDRTFVQKLRDQFSDVFGCFNDVILVMFKTWFSSAARGGSGRRGVEAENGGHWEDGEEDKF